MQEHTTIMNWQIAIRALGIVSLIVFAGLTAQYGLGERELLDGWHTQRRLPLPQWQSTCHIYG